MNPFIYFIFGVITGGLAVLLAASLIRANRSTSEGEEDTERSSANVRIDNTVRKAKEGLIAKQAKAKEEGKKRILGVLETQAPLTNNHLEQLLGISDATATRYLDELEKEGKIKQIGRTGRSVYYEKI